MKCYVCIRKSSIYEGNYISNINNIKLKTSEGMEIILRNRDVLNTQSFRIKLKGQEFMLREDADGLYISKVESSIGKDVITIQPKVANSIVVN